MTATKKQVRTPLIILGVVVVLFAVALALLPGLSTLGKAQFGGSGGGGFGNNYGSSYYECRYFGWDHQQCIQRFSGANRAACRQYTGLLCDAMFKGTQRGRNVAFINACIQHHTRIICGSLPR